MKTRVSFFPLFPITTMHDRISTIMISSQSLPDGDIVRQIKTAFVRPLPLKSSANTNDRRLLFRFRKLKRDATPNPQTAKMSDSWGSGELYTFSLIKSLQRMVRSLLHFGSSAAYDRSDTAGVEAQR